jgi:trans-aconitate methyltransferase
VKPPILYGELVSWYRLVDPPIDHADEAVSYQAAIERVASPRPESLLELGAGAGHNALYLKRRFRCTLADLSEGMQALSRELNPECEHVLGDMRTLRLGRTFDAVFVHDAIVYMTTEDDLRETARTAFVHTRPGGAAVFAPDYVRETYRDSSILLSADEGGRSLRGVEWVWDPDPSDDTYLAEYSFLLREGGDVRAVHDRHLEGLFSAATWQRVLASVGWEVGTFERPLDDETSDRCFVARRP